MYMRLFTVVGVWSAAALEEAAEIDYNPDDAAESAIHSLLNLANGSRLVFTKDGELILANTNKLLTANLGSISYADDKKGSLMVRIGAFGISTSAPINYEYDGPNKLYLEAYGQRLTLIRQTGEKPDDYKNLTQDGIGFEINGTEIQINDDAIEDVQEGLDGIIDGLKDSIGQ